MNSVWYSSSAPSISNRPILSRHCSSSRMASSMIVCSIGHVSVDVRVPSVKVSSFGSQSDSSAVQAHAVREKGPRSIEHGPSTARNSPDAVFPAKSGIPEQQNTRPRAWNQLARRASAGSRRMRWGYFAAAVFRLVRFGAAAAARRVVVAIAVRLRSALSGSHLGRRRRE